MNFNFGPAAEKEFQDHKEENLVLQHIIRRSTETVAAFMKTQQHQLEVAVPQEAIWVYGDAVRLTQIFTNILYNAAKYTPEGGHIRISTHTESGEAVVMVTDNGIGIEPDRLDRIFEPFVHTGPRRTVGTGLGIGLSLTKRLVDMHRGSIEAQSEGEGKGSTFVVRLPLTPVPARAPLEPPFSDTRKREQYRILIVDDNQAAAQGLEKLLIRKGHEVQMVYDGQSALSAVPEIQPDVVLLDIGLPDMNGYEVARRLRMHIPTPYIVALTGYGKDDDKEKAAVAGFNYHLTKPVGLSDVEEVLASLRF
jgi:CheY-like chemotaxis protein/two-component sensor histidine kinase